MINRKHFLLLLYFYYSTICLEQVKHNLFIMMIIIDQIKSRFIIQWWHIDHVYMAQVQTGKSLQVMV